MNRMGKVSALIALSCTVAVVGLVVGGAADAVSGHSGGTAAGGKDLFTGTKKISFEGRSVNVSCSGRSAKGEPVVVLVAGAGDGLEKFAGIQKTLSEKVRVCSYDRLGEGASDKPGGRQTINSTGRVLTAVIDRAAGDAPVVLAGHSLGGLIAARYAPDHRDRVKGLVLMDATSPTMTADIIKGIPASATGMPAQLRAQTLAGLRGDSPEQLVIPDGKVRSAGSIPVEVLRHGKQYLAALPQYGPGLERAWAKGEHKWLAVSSHSKLTVAKDSEHYIYLDQPELAVKAIETVVAQAAHRA